MKRVFLLVYLLLIPFVIAENLYNLNGIEVNLEINGDFELDPTKANYIIKEANAKLHLVPKTSHRQDVISIESIGAVEDDLITFMYDNPAAGTLRYGFTSNVRSVAQQIPITTKQAYPIPEQTSLNQYLIPTAAIDSDNPSIVRQASQLAEGKDDLFEIVFSLASWTEDNIQYNLSSLTADASLPASWVLKNRIGVCDEMTSLFIAMSRSLGIPARFVKGISYTTAEYFDENWLPHGWAEVYFPEVGWVSFDPTFGQYGYVDVTHFKLRDSPDPKSGDVLFQMKGQNVEIVPGSIDSNVRLISRGHELPADVEYEISAFRDTVGFGSFNFIEVGLQNLRGKYLTTTMTLSVPEEISITGRERKSILLKPNEEKHISWFVRVPENLDNQYRYTFPYRIFSERNVSIASEFVSENEELTYSLKELRELTNEQEEVTYTKELSIDCDYPQSIASGEPLEVTCTMKNRGNKNLVGLNFCIEEKCQSKDLLINQESTNEYTVENAEVGRHKLQVSAKNGDIDQGMYIEYTVFDQPKINMSITLPEEVFYNQAFDTRITMDKDSFGTPVNVTVSIQAGNFVQEITLDDLAGKQDIVVPMNSKGFTFNEPISITVTWYDESDESFKKQDTVTLSVKPNSFWDKVVMFINKIF